MNNTKRRCKLSRHKNTEGEACQFPINAYYWLVSTVDGLPYSTLMWFRSKSEARLAAEEAGWEVA